MRNKEAAYIEAGLIEGRMERSGVREMCPRITRR
jgi:hypothetical protein